MSLEKLYKKLTAEPLLLGLDYIAELTDEQILEIIAGGEGQSKPLPPESEEAKREFVATAVFFGRSVEQAEALYYEQLRQLEEEKENGSSGPSR